ncbi:MAG TPA: hypothetical protein PKW95_17215 [bacterium]|nr:hypothetical protein [bacterium]
MRKWLPIVLLFAVLVLAVACSKDEQAEAEKAAAEFPVDITGSYTGSAELIYDNKPLAMTAKLRIGPDRKIERLEWQGWRTLSRTDDLLWTPDGSVRLATTFFQMKHGSYQDRDGEFRMERKGAHLEVYVNQPRRAPIHYLQFSYDYTDTEMATIDAGGVFAIDPSGECLTTTVKVVFPAIAGSSITPDNFEMGLDSSTILKHIPGADQMNRSASAFGTKIIGEKNTTFSKVQLSNTPKGQWLINAVKVDTNTQRRTLIEHPDTMYSITITEPAVRQVEIAFCTDGRKYMFVPDRKFKYELKPGM